MRPGQNKRIRGRNRRGPNPLTRSFESNGPDVKVRGTAQHVTEKYTQLARDAHVSGDPVAAESYLQHAEHYYRIIAAAHLAQQMQINGTADDRDDLDDEDFDTTNDRFTFRAPQSMNPQANGQPYSGERQPGEFGEGSDERGEGEEGGQERVQSAQPERGPERPNDMRHQPRPNRDERRGGRGPERSFRPRNDGGQDRIGQDRIGQDRIGQDRPGSDRTGSDRPNTDRPVQDRFNSNMRPRRVPSDVDANGEQPVLPALPAFLTAPTRPVIIPIEPAAELPDPGGESEESVRSQFRLRRRRRGRPGREGGDEGGAEVETSGSDPV